MANLVHRAVAAAVAATCLTACVGMGDAERTSRAATRHRSSTTYFHYGTGAGPVIVSDDGGAVVHENRDSPFGVSTVVSAAGAAGEPYGGLNQPVDPATGLSYHGARWYEPGAARWLTPDPPTKSPNARFALTPWDLHPYQYVRNNPVSYWDPDGRELLVVGDGADALVSKLTGLTGYRLQRDKQSGRVSIVGRTAGKQVSKSAATHLSAVIGSKGTSVRLVGVSRAPKILVGDGLRTRDGYLIDVGDLTELSAKVHPLLGPAALAHELYEATLFVRGSGTHAQRHEAATFFENDVLGELGAKFQRGKSSIAANGDGTSTYRAEFGQFALQVTRDRAGRWRDFKAAKPTRGD